MSKSICVVLAIVLCLFANGAYAQTVTASITGTVTDPSSAVAPNVKVTATNTTPSGATSSAALSAGR